MPARRVAVAGAGGGSWRSACSPSWCWPSSWFANSLFQPFKGDGGDPVRVTIPQGATLSQIADRLERSGVVEDAGFFQLRARIDGASGDLRPGSYELRKDMSFTSRWRRSRRGCRRTSCRSRSRRASRVGRSARSRRACAGTTCAPASARRSSIRATTTPLAARASRASSSRPRTSSRRAAACRRS